MPFTSGYKVNTNTDYEFTVSNETITEVITNDGITESDIADYCYTALHDSRINALHTESSSAWSYGPSEFDGWVEDDCVFRLFRGVPIPTLNKTLNEPVTDVYERNLLTWNGTIYPGTENEKTGTFLVMDMKDIKKWYAEYTTTMFSPTSVSSTATKYGQTSVAPGYTGSCYTYISNTVVNYSIEPAEETEVDGTLRFLNVFVLNDELWVGLLNPSSHGEAQTMHSVNSWYNGGNNFVKGYLNVNEPSDKLYQRGTTGYYGVSVIPDLVYESAVDTDLQTYPEGANGVIMYGNCANSQINLFSGDYAKDLDTVLTWQSWGGLKFKFDNTMYKPIIQGGVIVGYSDDMTTPSEYDNMTNVTGNNISPTPPTPPAPDAKDNEIDVNMQQFSPTQCFVNYIEMSTENMIKLASGFNTYNASIWNIGGDLMKNLISYKIFAVYGTHSGTIKNVSIGGHEIEYNSAPISGNYIDDMGTVDLGSIEIGSKFRFNDWRDYAPYTKIECFVPCCGWCQLPPWCMGRIVTGTLYIDIANGSCKAVIKAGRTPVAEIGGCVAMDVPFSSVATGAKAAGIITAITNGAVSAFNPTPQNLISGSFGILSSLNANYTETKGVMGDGSNINGCTDFLIKVTRPASTDTGNGEITARYKHEKGIPCAKTKTLTSGQGFTQITDANIDGTMTDREKQMIIDGFRHGLIL